MATTKNINDATREELLAYARNHLGLHDLPGNILTNALKGKIRAVSGGESIVVDDAAPAASIPLAAAPRPVVPSDARAALDSKNDPRVTLLIAKGEGVDGDRPVYVGVNGRGMLVPRGEQVTIAYRYYLVLQNAVQTLKRQDPVTLEETDIDVPLYPVSVIRFPAQEEIDAWHAATGHLTAAA